MSRPAHVSIALALTLASLAGLAGACSPATTPGPAAPPAGALPYKKVTPSKDYPLTTCVMTGNKLGEMGDPIAIEYKGQEVQFCCPDCVEPFLKDPEPALAKIAAAKAAK